MNRWLVALLVWIPTASAAEHSLYFIDAHSQVDHDVDLGLVMRRMDEAGVHRTILSTRGRRAPQDVVRLAERHPGRIVPAVRTKGRAYQDAAAAYYTELKQQVESRRFQAISEVLIYHARKGNRAPEVIAEPDDPRVRAALEAALANQWPFIAHIEFAALGGDARGRFWTGLEQLLGQHPQLPIGLIHMGQLGSRDVQRLIEAHRNVFFLTSHASPSREDSKQPWVNLFDGEELAREWRDLFIQFPDRFVFAIDNVWPEHWQARYGEEVTRWRKALSALPPPVSRAVAHGNAERLWRLVPKP